MLYRELLGFWTCLCLTFRNCIFLPSSG